MADDRKALDVVAIDLRGRSAYADFVIVASGTSDRHVQGIAEFISKSVKELGYKIIGAEGMREGQWALIDMGDVVVHVFHQFTRNVYQIEDLLRDPRLQEPAAKAASDRRA